ncbi:MAG: dockerin type I repeat-containing protein [Phycisphaerae bacterium]
MNGKRMLALASGSLLLSTNVWGALCLCFNDSAGNRRCIDVPNIRCRDLAPLGPGEACYDLAAGAAPPNVEGVLFGSHPFLNTSVVLGAIGEVAFVGRIDGENFAVRSSPEIPDRIEVAALPAAPDMIALGPVLTGVEFFGNPIELPSVTGDFHAGDVDEGDFAMYFARFDAATSDVLDFRIVPVQYADLEFVILSPPCPADLNGDAMINLSDLAILLGDFGVSGPSAADIDGDGSVNLSDLATLLASFGSGC